MMKKSTKQSNTTTYVKTRLPRRDEQFAVVIEMSGGSRMKAICQDGNTRMVRIGGKLKRRMWCRENDLILVKPWTVQEDIKSDLVYRYLPTERKALARKKLIPEDLNIW